jgi:hypothetical protein
MHVTLVQHPPRLMGREGMKKSRVFECHVWYKGRLHVKITNEDIAHHLLQYQEYCSLQIHSTRLNNQASLYGNIAAVT